MKKPYDKGLFTRRGSPNWWIRYADRTGRIRRESTGTRVKKLAKEILAKKRVQVAENRHLDVKKIPRTTLFQLCEQWWNTWGKHKRMKGLDNMLNIWKSALGDLPLSDLSQQKIEQFLSYRIEKDRITPATRNRHLTMLKAMLNKAIEWELLWENPTAKIPMLKENGARTRFLDQEEIAALLEAASPGFRPVAITALHSGMRRGELLNLKWLDVDFKNRIITIQKSKSGKKRTIPMDRTLYETLRDLPSRFEKGYVFPSPVKPGKRRFDWQRQFRNAVDGANIEDIRFHDLRHTFASHLVMNGVDLKTVQELLGHSSITMTMRYAHLAPEHASS